MVTDTKTLTVANLATDKPQDAAPPVAPPQAAPQPPEPQAANAPLEDDDFDSLPSREPEKPAITPEPAAPGVPAAKAPSPETTPPPQRPPHPRGLVRRALELGLPSHVIETASTEDLDEWVYQSENQLRFQALQQRRQTPAAQAATPQEDELGLGELEKDLHPNLRKVLLEQKKTTEAMKQELAHTRQTFAQREQQRAQQEMFATWDRAFRSMPAKFKKVVGDGDGHTLPSTSEEMRARMDLIQVAGITPQDNAFTIEKKIHDAASRIYGKFLQDEAAAAPAAAAPTGYQPDPAAPVKGRITKEQWDKAALAQPSQRNSKEGKGEKAAMMAARQWMIEHKITDDDDVEVN